MENILPKLNELLPKKTKNKANPAKSHQERKAILMKILKCLTVFAETKWHLKDEVFIEELIPQVLNIDISEPDVFEGMTGLRASLNYTSTCIIFTIFFIKGEEVTFLY